MSFADRIADICRNVSGEFGVSARRIVSGDQVVLDEHKVFPSASVIKVPLMVEVMCQRDEGRLSLDETFRLREVDRVSGSGVLHSLSEGLALTLRDLTVLMIIVSDNTATNLVIDRLGMDSVNERMRGLGLKTITLARKMYDWEQQKLGRENLITPHDMTLLLARIAEGAVSSRSTSEEMLDIMARQQYRDKIPLLLPENTKVANKTGSIPRVMNDAGVVFAPSGAYAICVCAREVDDMPRAERAVAEISRAVYDHFEGLS